MFHVIEPGSHLDVTSVAQTADMNTEPAPRTTDTQNIVFFRFPTTLSENVQPTTDWRPGQGPRLRRRGKNQSPLPGSLPSPFAAADEQADD